MYWWAYLWCILHHPWAQTNPFMLSGKKNMTSSWEIPPLHYLRFWTAQTYVSSASNNLQAHRFPHSLKITQTRKTTCQAEGTTTTLLWHAWGQKGSPKAGALRNRKQLFLQNATLQNLTQALRDRQGETFQGISHYSQNAFLVQGPK